MGETNSYLNSPLLRAEKARYKVVRAEPYNAGMKFTLRPVVPSCTDRGIGGFGSTWEK